jgi:nitrogen fixation NifU-like protein
MRRFSQAITTVTFAQVRTKYSEKVDDHYRNPRNVGKMDKTDDNVGSALRGAPECGDAIELFLKINPTTEVIEETKFKAFGCGSAIASTSYVSEVLRGKTLAEAMELTNKDIASELSLPPVKLHCSMLAEETIRAAVSNYISKKKTRKTKVAKKIDVAA